MATDDRSGLEPRRKLDRWLGDDAAEELMNRMPPISWSDAATKPDVDAAVERLGAELRSEFRAELHGETRSLRAEVVELRASASQAIEAQPRRIVGFALTGLAPAAARPLF